MSFHGIYAGVLPGSGNHSCCSALKIPRQLKNSAWINLYQNQRAGSYLYRTINSAGHTVNFLRTRCQEADALMPILRTVFWLGFPVFISLRILSYCFLWFSPAGRSWSLHFFSFLRNNIKNISGCFLKSAFGYSEILCCPFCALRAFHCHFVALVYLFCVKTIN